MSDFTEFFHQPIARRALLACVMIGFGNGYVSALVVLRRSSLKMGTISHSLLPGIAVAVLFFGLTQWSVLGGAAIAALLVGLGSLFLSRTSRLDQETALGVLYTASFAAGMLILRTLGLQQKLDEWLFGSIVGMNDSDMWIAYGITFGTVLFLTTLMRPLLIFLFEPNVAQSLGVPVRLLNYGVFAVVILVLVSSLQAVGCILSVGLLTIPAATMRLLTNDARWMFWGGGLIGALGATVAFFLAYPLDWDISSTIIVVLGLFALLAYLFSPSQGLLLRWVRER
ncbi:MAG: metal ABC transporter permease [Verrucomicrobiales bacterium]|nr:metal ABC transporter permease [Verrucomicrobiales bacterium]MCP5553433.1 metal ABC transporter permease [Akkermansiaceae bacterium]HRX55784.1 metal ABC transporter permease [Verrucomicrobiales bacterium]